MNTKRILYLLTASLVAMVVLIIALANKNLLPSFIGQLWTLPYGDKVGHFMLIGGVGFLVNLCLECKTWSLGRLNVLRGSAIVGVLITGEEFSQIFVPHRTFDLGDLACNYAGILCFGWLAVRVSRRLWPEDCP